MKHILPKISQLTPIYPIRQKEFSEYKFEIIKLRAEIEGVNRLWLLISKMIGPTTKESRI